jgi:predicted DsbA family dithiol-disulfide isomerase
MAVASATMAMDFSITWKPFFLDPNLPGGEGKDKLAHYKAKFGADRVAQMMPTMVQTFKDEGIDNYSINGKVGNTMDSHRLLEFALKKGGPAKQDRLVEILFNRYFLQGRALSSRPVLLEAAAEAGLDGAEQLLASDALSEDVWTEVEGACQAGVTGVPYFRIDGGGRGKEVSGGQAPEVFLQILSSLGPPELALGFALRSQVRIQGLVSKPQFNGKLATVLGPQGGERVQVRMADGTEIALKPSNLEAFVAEANSANLDSA